jgi:murein DD-endopeptidase MepM/ murein hydrolase activator NlpD
VFDRDVPLTRDGTQWHGLIGIDLTVKAGTYPIALAVEETTRTLTSSLSLVVADRQFPVRRLTVAPSYVDPPADEVARITREAAALRALFAGIALPRQWQGAFQPPVSVRANSSFGARSVFNGQERSPHSGTDFSARAGTAVSAPAAGVVALAEPLYFTGNTVVLDHGLGLYSLLAHLSAFSVKTGDVVSRGHIVGTVGATGRATGAHLHWGVQLNGTRVDPLTLLAVTKAYESRPQP